jgi:ABC-type transport system involved in multi-copper enzyme maturation permease subunit
MLRTLIGKEVLETVLDLRFVIVTVLFIVLIPLGMYVGRKDYERRLANYHQEHQMYRQHYGNKVGAEVAAEGFRHPSPLSIFASGLDPFMPDKAVTSRSGLVRAVKQPGIDNAEALLFGKADFLFNVGFVVSLAALIFSFNRISGEKERGTLRALISNSVRRTDILLAKVVANYATLLIPFSISLLIALLILTGSKDISIFSAGFLPALMTIMALTFLFILVMVCLGVCPSTFTHSSVTSIMAAFLIWVIFVLGVPKIGPMIAEIVYPIESRNVANLAQKIAQEQIEKEFDQKKRQLYDRCREAFGLDLNRVASNPSDETERKANARYDQEVASLDGECQRRVTETLRQLEQDYRNKRSIQMSVAVNLSRLSPVSCYTYLVSSLSGTGAGAPNTFARNAERYQDQVKRAIYDNIAIKRYGGTHGGTATSWKMAEGFDLSKASIPDMTYQYMTLTEALQAGWMDAFLLVVFAILFFAIAFVRFGRYDVR